MFNSPSFPIVVLVWLLITIIAIYIVVRQRSLSDVAQALWILIILLFPFIGSLIVVFVTLDKRKRNT